MHLRVLWLAAVIVLASRATLVSSYKAGSAQYYPLGTFSTSPSDIVLWNLASYENITQHAHAQGVHILVFPEGGLGWVFSANRSMLAQHSTPLPDVSTSEHRVNPCTGDGLIDGSAVVDVQIYTLSCYARKYSMVLVANLVVRAHCARSKTCASDGLHLYNTNVVFDSDGAFIAVYHKAHLFSEQRLFDVYPHASEQPAQFSVSFPLARHKHGKRVQAQSHRVTFGMLICFDMEFREPTMTLLRSGIRHFVFSSWWVNGSPFLTATSIQQGFSRAYGVALIAANSASSPYNSGGGIYLNGEPLAVFFNPGVSQATHLLVTSLPDEWGHTESSSFPLPLAAATYPCCHRLAEATAHSTSHFGDRAVVRRVHETETGSLKRRFPCYYFGARGQCVEFSPPTVETTKRTHVRVRSGRLQCRLDYVGHQSAREPFVLMAVNHDLNFPNVQESLRVEACFVVRCDRLNISKNESAGASSCVSTYLSHTVFTELELRGVGFSSCTQVFPVALLQDGKLISSGMSFEQTTNDSEGHAHAPCAQSTFPQSWKIQWSGNTTKELPLVGVSLYGTSGQ